MNLPILTIKIHQKTGPDGVEPDSLTYVAGSLDNLTPPLLCNTRRIG